MCFNEGLVSVGYIVCFLGSSVITCTEFVNMYHSNTPEYVKEKNCTDMGSDSGKIRVLICTNAAGMGFKQCYPYGVPPDWDIFVQCGVLAEMGHFLKRFFW